MSKKDCKHEPFINPLCGGKAVEFTDEDGLLGKKGKKYCECYICNSYYDPKTKKTAVLKKSGKKIKGTTNGEWRV